MVPCSVNNCDESVNKSYEFATVQIPALDSHLFHGMTIGW